jgi:signal transduction histidine kinase/ActR/RegA family two-component response regulator
MAESIGCVVGRDRRDIQLEVLSRAVESFAMARAPHELFETVTEEIARAFGSWCMLAKVSHDGSVIAPVSVGGGNRELGMRLFEEKPIPTTGTHGLARCITTRECVVLGEITPAMIALRFSRPEDQAAVLAVAPRFGIMVPMLAHDTPVGALTLIRYGVDAEPFDEVDQRFAKQLAAHAALAILNTRLRADREAEVRERARIAERLRRLSEVSARFAAATGDQRMLLDLVTRTISETIDGLCMLRLLGADGLTLEPDGSVFHRDSAILAAGREIMRIPQRVGEGITGRILATGEPVLINGTSTEDLTSQSAPRYRAFFERHGLTGILGVPLIAHNAVIGAITVWSDSPRGYDEDDLLYAQDLAMHAALAIKNSRLLAEAQRELAERRRAEDALQRTEEQLRHAQKMEAVGRLAGGIAHDFNNLLSVVLGYSTFMLDQVPPKDPLHDDLQQIKLAGERAADLTRQLLAFSRQQVLEPSVVQLDEVVRGLSRMLERLCGESVAMRTAFAPDLGRVKADPGNIEQVIVNLVVNARDAMPTGGALTIETANVELDAAYARDHLGVSPGPHVMLAISDTGHGMDRETQQRIFEPFFTTKEKGKGTGLGLSTVFGIVQQNRGSIWVYSEPGQGTTFKVFLPRTDEVPARRGRTTEMVTLRGDETVLLVEDDDQVRQVAVGILRRAGYQVLEARGGGEAILISERHATPIEALVSDVVMPLMSGPDLAARLAPQRPAMKVLFMSGYTDDAILHHRVVTPGITLLQKPLTPDALLRKLRTVLDADRR